MTPITRGLARDSCRSIQQELSNITSSHPLLLYQIQGVTAINGWLSSTDTNANHLWSMHGTYSSYTMITGIYNIITRIFFIHSNLIICCSVNVFTKETQSFLEMNGCTIGYCSEYEQINLVGFLKCYTLLR